jgi:hypothetical protein
MYSYRLSFALRDFNCSFSILLTKTVKNSSNEDGLDKTQ